MVDLVYFKKIKVHHAIKDTNNWISNLFSMYLCTAQNVFIFKVFMLTTECTCTEAWCVYAFFFRYETTHSTPRL